MIKFNCLIHKETGTVIKYEDWKRYLEKEKEMSQESEIVFRREVLTLNKGYVKDKEYAYKPKDMLFSDDFEIIYDSELTTEEQKELQDILNNYNVCIDDFKILAEFTTQTNRHRNDLYKYLWRV